MSKDTTLDNLIIETENEIINHNAHTRKVGKHQIKVRSSVEKARDDYKAAKRHHKAQIAKLRDNIKSHKLLIKQAKTSYKLVKLADKA